ncbi:MAG: hypothetical protein QHH26_01420 [Armatimonadota bacterium]|nr:hypothetical protein [Armatimonadota bacterium]
MSKDNKEELKQKLYQVVVAEPGGFWGSYSYMMLWVAAFLWTPWILFSPINPPSNFPRPTWLLIVESALCIITCALFVAVINILMTIRLHNIEAHRLLMEYLEDNDDEKYNKARARAQRDRKHVEYAKSLFTLAFILMTLLAALELTAIIMAQ